MKSSHSTDSAPMAQLFSALSHPTRVDILKCLLPHAPHGLATGELGQRLDAAPSTLSHHLREMEQGGILRRHPNGRSTRITLDLDRLAALAETLMGLCCCATDSAERPPQEQEAE